MKHKWLTTTQEHNQFIDIFAKISGNPLDIKYLQSARVRGFFQDGHLVGGYIINTTQPLRYYLWIPEKERGQRLVKKHFDDGQIVEITCIWGDVERISRLKRRWIYWMCVFDAMMTGKKWILGGSIIPKVAKIHRQVLPNVVYDGTTTLPDHPKGQLYCARWIQLLMMIPIGFTYDIGSDILRSLVKSILPATPAKNLKEIQ